MGHVGAEERKVQQTLQPSSALYVYVRDGEHTLPFPSPLFFVCSYFFVRRNYVLEKKQRDGEAK